MLSKSLCAFGLALLWVPMARSELTLETGDTPGQLYFLWQDTLTNAGATSHRLSRMRAFEAAYSKELFEEIEVLDVRELDTDQPLKFSYAVRSASTAAPRLRDVVWYYPNPIPSGGRTRVQIRGRISASKAFTMSEDRMELQYQSNDKVFTIIPLGYAPTYCNSPIIVYEKNARTVCSFNAGKIAVIAKNVKAMAASKLPPTIAREQATEAVSSRLPLTVQPCDEDAIIDAAQARLGGSHPVVLLDLDEDALGNGDSKKYILGKTLLWKINDVIVVGVDGYNYIAENLEIGSKATVHLAEAMPDGKIQSTNTMSVRVCAAKEK